MLEIIPSPGTENKEWTDVQEKIESVRPFAKTLHIDVLDGKFAPNTTFFDPKQFTSYTKDFLVEVHLMVEDPLQYLKPWAEVGVQRFIGQVEKMSNQAEFVAQAQLLGEVGLALDKQTPVEAITASLEDLDCLLVMTIQAGFSGQEFEESLLEKVKVLRAQTALPIEVDGGINDETILIAAAAGANRFAVTSFLFNLQTPQEQHLLLQKKLQSVGI